jgi:NADH-quinone oxidoreductase subunit C
MADDPSKPPVPPAATPNDPTATPPAAAADKPASATPGEPLKAEVSRTDSPGAGVSAAPVQTDAAPATPPAPKPANPTAQQTTTTSETSSATGARSATSPTNVIAEGTPAAPAKPAVAAETAAGSGAPKAPAPAAARPPAPGAPRPAAPAAARPAAPGAAKPAAGAAAHAGPEHVPKAAPPSGPPDPPPPADKTAPAFVAALQSAIPGAVTAISYWVGDWTIIVAADKVLETARHLRYSPDAAFDLCTDLTATDWPPRAERFDLVYCLYSTRHRHRVRMKVKVAENQPVASVTPVWPACNWLEREVWDMFGVNFTGHPDRRRILMPEDWQGFPQRKDYPLEGPGELLMENPLDWLKLRQAKEEADIE